MEVLMEKLKKISGQRAGRELQRARLELSDYGVVVGRLSNSAAVYGPEASLDEDLSGLEVVEALLIDSSSLPPKRRYVGEKVEDYVVGEVGRIEILAAVEVPFVLASWLFRKLDREGMTLPGLFYGLLLREYERERKDG